MVIEVDESTLAEAAVIHSRSWIDSHVGICGEAFLRQHTPARQAEYLRDELRAGKRLYMLRRERGLGVVSVWGDLIENLYVLPEAQGRGCGTALLAFAMARCVGAPRLWILETNDKARALYEKHGFRPTGERHQLTETLAELELRREEQ